LDKNKIKIILILLVIILVICTIFIIYSLNKKAEDKTQINIIKKTEPIETTENNIKDVQTYEDYFIVNSAVNKFLTYNSMGNSEAVYALLDKDFIDKNNITKENVLEKLGNIKKTEILINKMDYQEINEFNAKYTIEGFLYNKEQSEYEDKYDENIKREYEDIKLEMLIDKYNGTFSLIPKL